MTPAAAYLKLSFSSVPPACPSLAAGLAARLSARRNTTLDICEFILRNGHSLVAFAASNLQEGKFKGEENYETPRLTSPFAPAEIRSKDILLPIMGPVTWRDHQLLTIPYQPTHLQRPPLIPY
jgi:hypothetical protein